MDGIKVVMNSIDLYVVVTTKHTKNNINKTEHDTIRSKISKNVTDVFLFMLYRYELYYIFFLNEIFKFDF